MKQLLLFLLIFFSLQAFSQWEKMDDDIFRTPGRFGTCSYDIQNEFIWCASNSRCYTTRDFKNRKSILGVNGFHAFVVNDTLYQISNSQINKYLGDGVFQPIINLPATNNSLILHITYDEYVILRGSNLWCKFDGQTLDTLAISEDYLLHYADSILFFDYDNKLIRHNRFTNTSDTLYRSIKDFSVNGGFSNVLMYNMIPYGDKIAFLQVGSNNTRGWITDGKEVFFDSLYISSHRPLAGKLLPRLNQNNFFPYYSIKRLIYYHKYIPFTDHYGLYAHSGWFTVNESLNTIEIVGGNSAMFRSFLIFSIVDKLKGKDIGFNYIDDKGFELVAYSNGQQELLYESNKGAYGLFGLESKNGEYISTRIDDELFFIGFNDQGLCLFKTDGTKENSGLVAVLPDFFDTRRGLFLKKAGSELFVLALNSNGEYDIYRYDGPRDIIDKEPSNDDFFEVGIDMSTDHNNSKDEVCLQKNADNYVLMRTNNMEAIGFDKRFGAIIPRKKLFLGGLSNGLQFQDYIIFDDKGEIVNTFKVSAGNSFATLNDNNQVVLFANTFYNTDLIINDKTYFNNSQKKFNQLVFIIMNMDGSIEKVVPIPSSVSFNKAQKIEQISSDKYIIEVSTGENRVQIINDDGKTIWKSNRFRYFDIVNNPENNQSFIFYSRQVGNQRKFDYHIFNHKTNKDGGLIMLHELDELRISAVHIHLNKMWIAAYNYDRSNSTTESYLFEYTLNGTLIQKINLNGAVIKGFASKESNMLANYESLDSIGVYRINHLGKITGSYSNKNFSTSFVNQAKIHLSEDTNSFYILGELSAQFYWDRFNFRYLDRFNGHYFSYLKRPLSLIKDVDFISNENYAFETETNFILFPNPIDKSGYLTIIPRDMGFVIKEISIVNMKGQVLVERDVSNDPYPLRLKLTEHLASGRYVLILTDAAGKSEMHRLIVN
jgi:hypothetical protein